MEKAGKIDVVAMLWFLFIGFLCWSLGWYMCVIFDSSLERESPGLRLSSFFYTNDSFCLFYPNLTIAALIGTNSMDPLFDKGHYLIEINVKDINDIIVGDIVAFENEEVKKVYNISSTVHRVVAIDKINKMVKTKGDNVRKDDGWIPFESIKRVVVAIIY